MAESSRKTGSASSCFSEKGRAEKPGNKEHRKKHDKSNDKKLLLVIGFLIIDILLLVCFGRIEKYASDNLCESIFWDFFGDSQIQLFAVVGIEGIITVAIALSKKIKKKLTIFFFYVFFFYL